MDADICDFNGDPGVIATHPTELLESRVLRPIEGSRLRRCHADPNAFN